MSAILSTQNLVKKYGYTQVPLLRIAGSSPPVARQAQADAIRAWNGGGLPTAPALSSEALRKTNSVVAPSLQTKKRVCRPPFASAFHAPLLQHPLDVGGVVLHHGPVVVVLEERRRDQEIGRRAVDRRRDVVERRNAQQRLHVHVVGLRRHRVPKEDQSADLPIGDHRTELLVAAQRAGFEQRDVEMRDLLGTAPLRQRPRHHLTRCSGTNQVVPEQNLPIPVDPLRQIAFHVVVGHQCNFLLLFHRHLFSIIASRARKDSPLAGSVVSDRRSGIAAPPPLPPR